MKHFDDSSKKLIKNVAALLVSALVLIAATVAWFVSGGSATVGGIRGQTQSVTNNEFYQMPTRGTFLSVSTSTSGGQTIRSFGGVDTLSTQVADGYTWNDGTSDIVWASGSNWGIDSLIPGAYRQFKLVVNSTAKPSLRIDNIIPISDDSDHTALKSVYLQAAAFSSTVMEVSGVETNVYTQIGSAVCNSLYNLTDSAQNNYIDVVFDSTQISKFTVVINIGVPGTDSDSTLHDALRLLDASISFGPVGTSTGN